MFKPTSQHYVKKKKKKKTPLAFSIVTPSLGPRSEAKRPSNLPPENENTEHLGIFLGYKQILNLTPRLKEW